MSEANNRNSAEHTNKNNSFICGVVEGIFLLYHFFLQSFRSSLFSHISINFYLLFKVFMEDHGPLNNERTFLESESQLFIEIDLNNYFIFLG